MMLARVDAGAPRQDRESRRMRLTLTPKTVEKAGDRSISAAPAASRNASPVNYLSTRGTAPRLGFEDVLLAGLARDGGLYLPDSLPRLDATAIAALAGRPYAEVAERLIAPFTGDCFAPGALRAMTEGAYASFRHPAVVPMSQLDDNLFLLEIFHGPTLAFKDVAMQLLGRMMQEVLGRRGRRTTVVGATSGDTGAAAIEAFRGLEAVDVFILYPHGRVSDVQRRQMTGVDAPNIHAIAVEGTFDDCQAIVKALFNHHAFRDETNLSGVNSINWARVMAQLVYFFTGAVALGAPASHSSPSRCRPAISATCWRAGSPRRWACRSTGSSSPPTRTTSWPAASPPAPTRSRACGRPSRPPWTSRCRRTSSACSSRPMGGTMPPCAA